MIRRVISKLLFQTKNDRQVRTTAFHNDTTYIRLVLTSSKNCFITITIESNIPLDQINWFLNIDQMKLTDMV